jgi:hypothetical protein
MLDNGLPERIVSGREDTWIAGFVDWLEVVKGGVDPDAIAEYTAHLRKDGHLAASYDYFRAFHRDVEDTIRSRETGETPLSMPDPDAAALLGVCDRSTALGQDLVREAHADGSLSPDFTEDDLFSLLWLAGTASRDEAAPPGWVRIINRALESAWTD